MIGFFIGIHSILNFIYLKYTYLHKFLVLGTDFGIGGEN